MASKLKKDHSIVISPSLKTEVHLLVDTGGKNNILLEAHQQKIYEYYGLKFKKTVFMHLDVIMKGETKRMVFEVIDKNNPYYPIFASYHKCVGLIGYDGLQSCKMKLEGNETYEMELLNNTSISGMTFPFGESSENFPEIPDKYKKGEGVQTAIT